MASRHEVAAPVEEQRMETARYVRDLTRELAGLARKQEMPLLTYLLDMAQMEAANFIRLRRRSAA